MHGNSNQNERDHHLYEIVDRQRKDIFKYGIGGDPLNEDGTSPRANKQVKLFNNLVGWARFFANVLITSIPGRVKAKELEDEYIENYRQQHGRKPRGNL